MSVSSVAMELHFTPEQQAQIAEIATRAGTDPEHLVRNAVLRFLDDDCRFIEAVAEGRAAMDLGNYFTHEQLGERLDVEPDMRPIWEVMLDNLKDVPLDEFAKLPKDGAAEHDHYLYGCPKRDQ